MCDVAGIDRDISPSVFHQSLPDTAKKTENEGESGDTSDEDICRICHDNPIEKALITPCSCKGSMSKVHKDCLEQWLAKSTWLRKSCEICNFLYNTVRTRKYSGYTSVRKWMDTFPFPVSDLKIVIVVSLVVLYFAMDLYSLDEPEPDSEEVCGQSSLWNGTHCLANAGNPLLEFRRNRVCSKDCAPNPPSYHLNVWNLVLVVFYMVDVFLVISCCIASWILWQRSNYIVTIVPFKDGRMGFPRPRPDPRVRDSVTFVDETNSVIFAARGNSRSHGNGRLPNKSARGTAYSLIVRPEMASSPDTADNIRIGQTQAASEQQTRMFNKPCRYPNPNM